jgi:hypothetical protein
VPGVSIVATAEPIEPEKLELYDTQVQDYLKNSEKFKWDKKQRVVFRQDGGVENVSWAYLILIQGFLAFTFYTVIAATIWAVLAAAGVIGYGINGINEAQNAATNAARTYFRGSNPVP